MRWLPIAVLLVLARAAAAEVSPGKLATRVRQGDEAAIEEARARVLANDPKIRGPLLEALIDAAVIERASAAHVPTATALTSQLRALLSGKRTHLIPVAKDCRLTGGTARGATIACSASRCASACRHETTSLVVTTGKRWTIGELQTRSNEDGACGHCMLVE